MVTTLIIWDNMGQSVTRCDIIGSLWAFLAIFERCGTIEKNFPRFRTISFFLGFRMTWSNNFLIYNLGLTRLSYGGNIRNDVLFNITSLTAKQRPCQRIYQLFPKQSHVVYSTHGWVPPMYLILSLDVTSSAAADSLFIYKVHDSFSRCLL